MRLPLPFICLVSCVAGLFEDQAGKFDWKQSYVGQVRHLGFHTTSVTSVLVVATDSNVVAGLDADSGAILWRHVFENDELGKVWDLRVTGRYSVSASGTDLIFVRLWDSVSGAMVQEHLVRAGRVPDLVSVQGGRVVLGFYDGGEMEIVTHTFDAKKIGEAVRRIVKTPFQTGNIGGAKCGVSEDLVLVCAGGKGLHSLDLGEQGGWDTKEVSGVKVETLLMKGMVVEIDTDVGMVRLNTGTGKMEQVKKGVAVTRQAGCGGIMVQQGCVSEGRDSQGQAYCREYSQEIEVISDSGVVTHTLGEERGRVETAWSLCEGEDSWQLVMVMQDASMVSITPRGNLMFLREEGLASIDMVQMVGMGSTENTYEAHRPAYTGNMFDPQLLVQNFVSRIKRHVSLLQSLVLAVTDFRLSGASESNPGVGGDRFGLRKMVIGVTKQGKMYGLDSKTGTILWQKMFPGQGTALHIQRDGRTDNDLAQAVLVYRHARSTFYLMMFNPLTGAVISHQASPLELDQALLLPELPQDNSRPLLLVGKDSSAQVFPATALSYLSTAPKMFVVTEREGTLTGNLVTVTGSGVSLVPVWSMGSPGTKILEIRTRRAEEKVHSAGRVMADRSVLFKYMNPNLALVMSEGLDSSSKTFITVQVVDLVTGKVFFSATHKKVLPPFHVVHSENWAVYSYFNDKARRTELVSLEMYEGKEQSNATMFSSIDNTVVPLVERQAYILPMANVLSIEETLTSKGITSKHLLVGTSTGAVLDLPLHMVDPRRPALSTPAHLREPGIPPYTPEIPVPPESILNYNQSVEGIRGIVTSPSGLESTALVLVYGLDLYGTRVAPSKGFDLIKDDFEHLMIAAVLVGLLAASYGTRKLSQRKMLNQAWK